MTTNQDVQNKIADAGTTGCTIPSGKTVSNIFNCENMQIVALQTPANFTTATLTFKTVGIDGLSGNATKTLNDLDGNELQISLVANNHQPFQVAQFAGVKQVQVFSSVAQSEDTIISFVQAPLYV